MLSRTNAKDDSTLSSLGTAAVEISCSGHCLESVLAVAPVVGMAAAVGVTIQPTIADAVEIRQVDVPAPAEFVRMNLKIHRTLN
jgi:hypothetical protein